MSSVRCSLAVGRRRRLAGDWKHVHEQGAEGCQGTESLHEVIQEGRVDGNTSMGIAGAWY